jgi:lauroyl/myristoyl acyltransferase
VKTALIKALRWFASRRPRAAYSLTRQLARLSEPLGSGVPAEQIATLFPELDQAALRSARKCAWSNFLLGEALNAAMTAPGRRPVYPEIVSRPALAELQPPLILVFAHLGPYHALGVALEGLRGGVLALDRGGVGPTPGIAVTAAGDDEWGRARAFQRAVATLRSGGSVLLAIDGYEASTLEVPMLGGAITLARGPFALARMTGAPIVPVAAHWRGSSAEVACGDLIPSNVSEPVTAAATGAWLERHLRRFPGEISSTTLELFRPRQPRL